MDCADDEFSLHGECRRCPRCPPGHELEQDCGYGVGGASVCGVCDRRWFKEDWGSHSCRMCQNCRRLNRQEITPCTHTHNAVCGDCLPGFYSKRRLDGLQDLECLPCGSAHIRHTQCGTTVEAWSSEAPPLNTAAMMTACVMAVTMAAVLLIIMVMTYRGFNTLRKTLKGCLSRPSHCDIAATSVSVATEYSVTQEAEYGCLGLASTPLPAARGALFSDITSCAVVTQATGSHDGWSGWAGHGPVECTEREILHGEKRTLTSDVSRETDNTSTSLQGACLHQELLQQEHLPGADATANTANTANNEC
ncbi:tumor necrosis factor receptor superfamily member 27 isoform X1 [Ictalurus punctatus]|uniref:Tumor necrosis factor receptor superfamily member 27 isoform X1 n=2 Tax=Ictalurus punctatus TaxID=7998 RepID=A0A2D0QD71_ICTPU|nr:tumor necrosis factor receptor superfamily member 27 isoform X1 [Ictalurus punctatus]